MTVFDNLYFHGRYFGLPRAECRRRADELLARFDLTERREARRMAELIALALTDEAPRRPTRVPRAARQRRLGEKRHRASKLRERAVREDE